MRKRHRDIDPDEIFLDSSNLPQFDTHQFEGRIDSPISHTTGFVVLAFFILTISFFTVRAGMLQIKRGDEYIELSERNYLRHTPLFAARGVVYDRKKIELAWNAPSDDPEVLFRKYKEIPGLAHVLGYIQYPTKDSSGFYYREDFIGMDGVEKTLNDTLQGENGLRIIEVNALGKVNRENIVRPPKNGTPVTLSIDSEVQSKMHQVIKGIADRVGFAGGAGVIMDIHTGEIIALTSYPEYDSNIMSDAKDRDKINAYLRSKNTPFLDRASDGLYTPGSIIKPFMALAALAEKVIDPSKQILSTGSIAIQNEYDPKMQTIFKDWKAHGYTDMRRAIAVSSDVYFYTIGGGYKDQKGLGILKIDEYIAKFGFGEKVPSNFFKQSPAGVIPTPEWKIKNFDGDTWRLGNTYHTSIGQYGFQVTPLQAVRAVASIANNGNILVPTLFKTDTPQVEKTIDLSKEYYTIVQEGMRQGVLDGTGGSLKVPYVEIAAKSGTAELGASKEKVNSWMTGYFPYNNPKYAFAVVMEKGEVHNLIGAGAAFRELIDWMHLYTPEYFK
jgi:penicillin-binding protein 2